ncbi:MAG: hypothetical protein QM702_21180 [Rubrivivax sp.]
MPEEPQRRRTVARTLVVAWFVAMTAISAVLLGRHLLAFPQPADDAGQLRTLASDTRVMSVVHVLYAQCRCSQRIVDHLVTSERPHGVVETVLLVGDDDGAAARLVAHGFRVVTTTVDELGSRWRVTAVPLLVVIAPGGRVRYVGGYAARKQGPDPQDLAIIAIARGEGRLSSLPVYGCAVAGEVAERLGAKGVF